MRFAAALLLTSAVAHADPTGGDYTFSFVVFATPDLSSQAATPSATTRSDSTSTTVMPPPPPPRKVHLAYAVRDYIEERWSSGLQWGFGVDIGSYINWRTSFDYSPRFRWFSPFVGLAGSVSPHFDFSEPTDAAFFFLSAELGAHFIMPWGGIGDSKAAIGVSVEHSIASGQPFWSTSLGYSIGFQ
jgi:hypothetical protein